MEACGFGTGRVAITFNKIRLSSSLVSFNLHHAGNDNRISNSVLSLHDVFLIFKEVLENTNRFRNATGGLNQPKCYHPRVLWLLHSN